MYIFRSFWILLSNTQMPFIKMQHRDIQFVSVSRSPLKCQRTLTVNNLYLSQGDFHTRYGKQISLKQCPCATYCIFINFCTPSNFCYLAYLIYVQQPQFLSQHANTQVCTEWNNCIYRINISYHSYISFNTKLILVWNIFEHPLCEKK